MRLCEEEEKEGEASDTTDSAVNELFTAFTPMQDRL